MSKFWGLMTILALVVIGFWLYKLSITKNMNDTQDQFAKVVMVIASQNFRDEELFHTKEELEKAGASITIASTKIGDITGMLGGIANAEILVTDVSVSDFDAIVLVGGSGAIEFFDSQDLHNLLKEFYNKGKIVAAICISPSTLARAGLLNGKKATVWSGEADTLKEYGAMYIETGVVKDGNIITASGSTYAHDFGQAIAKNLQK